MATVSDHVAELRRLLHDGDDQYWTEPFKTDAVNRAIKQRDLITGGNRSLVSYTLTAGQETYTFTDLGNTRVFDVVGIILTFNGLRIELNQVSYTRLVTLYRQWSTYRDTPVAFARYGAAAVRLGPLPSQAYATEWDCCVFSADLTGSDSDPLPYPYTEPVPYYAAYLCKVNMRQFDEAEAFKDEFFRLCSLIEGARTGPLPSAYSHGRR